MHLRSRPAALVRALVASALGLSGLVAGTSAQAGTPVGQALCTVPSPIEPVRLADAVGSGVSAALVRAVNALTGDELVHLAEDGTTWVDGCGRVFVVEEAAPARQQVAADPAPVQAVPDDVLDLSSRPGADRTIQRVGRAYRAEIRFTGTVSEARVDRRLPLGLRWRVLPGRIVITGRVRTSEAGRFATVLSGDDSSVRRQFRLRVR